MLRDIPIPISIDTRSADVAETCLDRGFEIVNDASCGRFDRNLSAVVASADCVIIAMHSRGTPESMLSLAKYGNPGEEVFAEWQACAQRFYDAGCQAKNVWFDPGLGFAKDVDHCWKILSMLRNKRGPEVETVIGASRKRFVDVTNLPPDERDSASNAVIAILANAKRFVFRVHDVAGARQSALVAAAMPRASEEVGS
jgi:dihydropteroate synthase